MRAMQLTAAMWGLVAGPSPAGPIEISDHDRARRLSG
jgi:hypothetical protein